MGTGYGGLEPGSIFIPPPILPVILRAHRWGLRNTLVPSCLFVTPRTSCFYNFSLLSPSMFDWLARTRAALSILGLVTTTYYLLRRICLFVSLCSFLCNLNLFIHAIAVFPFFHSVFSALHQNWPWVPPGRRMRREHHQIDWFLRA